MKKYTIILISFILLATLLSGCNIIARKAGGTVNVELPKGKKLVTATWKEDSLWYLTRPMREDEQAETYEFQEDSNFGIVEGKVIIQEQK